MFTGLIEAMGRVCSVADLGVQTDIQGAWSGRRVSVEADSLLEGAKLGDSIAIDGVCTTVVALASDSFTVELSPETLSKTNLRYLQPGRRVNLERPLTPTSRLGGHFVTGHVDGTASLIAKFQEGNSWIYRFMLDQPALAMYFIPKGSVAVNGISLTVNTVDRHVFSVAIIPHTLAHTSLGDYEPGGDGSKDTVNIECDMLGKYVHRMLLLGRDQGTVIESGQALGPSSGESQLPKSKLHAGLWFCHDEAIHGTNDALIAHWPERPPGI